MDAGTQAELGVLDQAERDLIAKMGFRVAKFRDERDDPVFGHIHAGYQIIHYSQDGSTRAVRPVEAPVYQLWVVAVALFAAAFEDAFDPVDQAK